MFNKNKKPLNQTEVIDNVKESKSKYFTFDEIYKARTALGMSVLTFFFTIASIVIFFIHSKSTQDEVLKRIKERDILVLTSRGATLAKTSPVYNEIVKQFAIITFNSTLIYDPINIAPQLNFMRVYSSPDIFKKYSEMIQTNVDTQSISKKIYYASLDNKQGIKFSEEVPGKKYRITMFGKRDILANYSDSNNSYNFKLEIVVEKDLNSSIENMYGLKILTYNLTKI